MSFDAEAPTLSLSLRIPWGSDGVSLVPETDTPRLLEDGTQRLLEDGTPRTLEA